jgi:hypothetical protein
VLAQTSRTAVYGPVRTVVWEGSAGDRRPYPDQHNNELRSNGAFFNARLKWHAAYPATNAAYSQFKAGPLCFVRYFNWVILPHGTARHK